MLLLLGTANLIQSRSMLYTLFAEQQESHGVSIAAVLSSQSVNLILAHNFYDLHELARDTQKSNNDVRYVFITDPNGTILAHSFATGFPTDLLTLQHPQASKSPQITAISTEEGVMRDIALPVMEGRLGAVHVGLSDAGLQAVLDQTTRRLLFDTAAAVLVGIILAMLLAARITQPIRELSKLAGAITAGDFTGRARIQTQDEIGKLATAFNSMVDYLHNLMDELTRKEEARTHLLQKVIVAQEEERKRLARELHDETGQNLTSLMVGLKLLETKCPVEARCGLEDMRQSIRRTLEDIHRLAVELRPSILDDMGLIAAMEKYVADYRQNYKIDLDLHVTWSGDDRLAHEVELTAYRIMQEALTNAAKYSSAQNVSVLVTRSKTDLEVIIEDDGVGFDVAALMDDNVLGNKLGLYGMRERAQLVGGTLTIESSLNLGTTIYVRIPLAGEG